MMTSGGSLPCWLRCRSMESHHLETTLFRFPPERKTIMKPRVVAATLAGLLLLLPGFAGADIYRWKDANGVINFSNSPPPPDAIVLETIEETPFDAEAHRRRMEEERRLQLERRQLEIEERKADLADREREAQMKLDEAERRMQEARQVEQQARQDAQNDDCDDAYYLTYGSCGPPGLGYRYYHVRPGGTPDLYRRYYRENNSLYYKDRRKPEGHPVNPRPHPPDWKPAPRPKDIPRAVHNENARSMPEDSTLKGGSIPAPRK